MTPELITAFTGLTIAWLEFRSARHSQETAVRLAMLEHRVTELETQKPPCEDHPEETKKDV